MVVWASDDFKTILRYAKLARLMHTITRLPDGRLRWYSADFDVEVHVCREGVQAQREADVLSDVMRQLGLEPLFRFDVDR